MSRTQSEGLSYFPFAVDFFSDKKIRILKARYGTDGISIYIYLLCQIYREGYYTRVDEDFIFVISDDLGISPETVQQVMTFLLKRSMFNEQLFKSDAILTSDGIQERWQTVISTRAAKTPIKVSDYWLLSQEKTKPFIHCANFENFSEKKSNNSEKKSNNSKNYPQSKVKESKVNKNPPLSEEDRARATTPTKDEVLEYCNSKGYPFGERFYMFYSRKGWPPDWMFQADWWNAQDKERGVTKSNNSNQDSTSSFDIDEVWKAAIEHSRRATSETALNNATS